MVKKKGLSPKSQKARPKEGRSLNVSSPSFLPEDQAEPIIPEGLPFPIVGVGASAGGLEAFMELFRSLPPDTGLAFVLIQHLSPQHLSMLSTLVQKATRMQVQEAQQGMRVCPNQVYVIPPNALLEIYHGVLHLGPLAIPHGVSLPVDTFFTCLARDQGNLAIGMILSGTGSDGAHGLREIKADGGITLVQDPKDAKFDGMPNAAISEAAPDFVLKVDDLARELVKIASHPIVKKTFPIEETRLTPEAEQILPKIFILLRGTTKIDFSNYKYSTIIRRIKRRMIIHRIETIRQYLTYLQTTPVEVDSLFQDLLINVTDFFRDVEAFESLKTRVFPEITKDRIQGTAIRIWVPGCSTGEEVYSIAMALIEFLGDSVTKFPVQIYGTDICQSALKIARAGIFPESAVRKVSAERLERFFVRDQGGYRITRLVRDCCIFSIQDVTSQPPINRLDLLSCRNLLIYLGLRVQQKLMETFCYALNPNGFLMLGSSESVGVAVTLFSIIDKKNKIYVKKSSSPVIHRDYQDVQAMPAKAIGVNSPQGAPLVRSVKSFDPIGAAERLVLDQYAPAWVLVNRAMDIIQFRGETDNFIAPASGQPSWNLLKMLRNGMAADIRILIHAAEKEGRPIRKNGLRVTSGGLRRIVDVEAVPITHNSGDFHCLVLFITREKTKAASEKSGKSHGKLAHGKNTEILRLREELELTQNSLQSIIEDLNITNEEMQSANEEVSSANEELQSTNEELETAKEELQSTNEELTSLNDELTIRNHELDLLSNDLINVLSNANVSIVMVGADLCIRRFTPMAEKSLKLIAADVGRNIMDINLGFKIENFEQKIREVITSRSTIELETLDRENRWHSVQIRPYRTTDNKIEGVVLVFINIDDIKKRETEVKAAERYSDGIIQTVRDPLIVLDKGLHVERANQAFYKTFKVTPEETIGRLFYELGNGQWNIPTLRTLLEEVLPKKLEVRDFVVTHKFEEIGDKKMVLNARTLEWEGQRKLFLLISLFDLTGREAILQPKAAPGG